MRRLWLALAAVATYAFIAALLLDVLIWISNGRAGARDILYASTIIIIAVVGLMFILLLSIVFKD